MSEENNTAVESAPVKTKRPAKHVAIVARTTPLALAMEAVLTKRLKGYTFARVSKISDRPAGSEIASLGLPNFIPGNDGVIVHAFNTRFLENATQDERSAQWDTVNDEDSSPEEILAELAGFRDYTILSQSKVVETKLALADIKLEIAQAESLEEQRDAYKAACELLQEALS